MLQLEPLALALHVHLESVLFSWRRVLKCLNFPHFVAQALGWAPANIVLYAWSIGGYSAGRALVARPDISAAVLDGTFDHILPLALGKMPKALCMMCSGDYLDRWIFGSKWLGIFSYARRCLYV